MRQRREGGGMTDITFNGGGHKFTAMNVPRQCPLVLLIKVGYLLGKAFGSGEGKEMISEARREVKQGHTVFVNNFEF
jgi:hypothetical protein